MQGTFVGVSLGYSFVLDERKIPRSFGPLIAPSTSPATLTVIPIFRVSANGAIVEGVVIIGAPGSQMTVFETMTQAILGPPVTTIGNNGTATVTFSLPGTSTSLLVWDQTNNLLSEPITRLQIAGEGIANLIIPVIGPDPATNRLPVPGDRTVTVYGLPNDSVVVSIMGGGKLSRIAGTHQLSVSTPSGTGTSVHSQTIPLKVDEVDRPLNPGDVLFVSSSGAPVSPVLSSSFAIPRLTPSNLTLGSILEPLANFGVESSSGFRLSQRFSNIFTANPPLDQIDPAIINSAFEPIGGAEDVRFLYSIDVVGTGRELQNKPIHNIAGLGTANGDRPFRTFATPIAFEPRSVIRVQIEELSTLPGTLFMVLQGYKILGTGRTPQ